MDADLTLTVDGRPRRTTAAPWTSLRSALDDSGVPLPAGCDAGHCGSCTVLLDQEPVPSCLVPAAEAEGTDIRTVRTAANPELATAFADAGAVQCGYCTPGMLVTLSDLLRRHAGNPLSAEDVRAALDGNLCRCTGYAAIVTATLTTHSQSLLER